MNKFSVVIPLYNKALYIEKTIKSILNQSYNKFEIIIINDGSTDNSLEIINEINDDKLRIINQLNQGVSVARNNGVANSNNEFIAFLDADDIWDKNFLYEMDYLIDKYPKAAIYASNNYFEFENGRKICENFDNLFNGNVDGIIDDYFKLFTEKGKSPFSNSNFVIRKDIFTRLGGYTSGVRLTEDSDLWSRVAIKYDIAYTKKPLATYYIYKNNSTHFIFEPKDFEVTLTLTKILKGGEFHHKHKKSIKKLIAFQKLNLIKRAIYNNKKSFVLNRIFKFNLIIYYPVDFLKCMSLVIVPKYILSKLLKINK